jgi:outer membrane protein OmpA-like peptidoglycan-associated protein
VGGILVGDERGQRSAGGREPAGAAGSVRRAWRDRREAREGETMRQVLHVVLLGGAVLAAGGCATRGWVQELVGKKEAEIDRRLTAGAERVGQVEQRAAEQGGRIEAVEGRVGEHGRKVEAVGARVQGLEGSVAEAGQSARTALGRAEEADARLTRLWAGRHQRTVVETAHVYFGLGRADLTDAGETALLALVKDLEADPGLTVELRGYADPSGSREKNIQLSQRRVEAVRRFLVERGVEPARIHAVGLGVLADRGVPAEQKRRVTLRVLAERD